MRLRQLEHFAAICQAGSFNGAANELPRRAAVASEVLPAGMVRWHEQHRTAASKTRHVALLVETSNACARRVLVGVKRYVEERPRWSIYLAEHSRHETDFSWLEGWHGDGGLARIENEETARFIRWLSLPTIDLSAARLTRHPHPSRTSGTQRRPCSPPAPNPAVGTPTAARTLA